MRLFVEQFYTRAGNDVETLIADITIESDGQPLDPAAWSDWLDCIRAARTLVEEDRWRAGDQPDAW